MTDPEQPIDGYVVIGPDGRRVGVVASVSPRSIVVKIRRWFHPTWHALPRTYASVLHAEHAVLMLIPARELTRSPKLSPDLPVDDARVAEFFGLERG
jgi:hypothetical protein